MNQSYQGRLVLGTVQGAFSRASGVIRVFGAPFSVSLHPFFIVVFFLLNGVLRVGTCPISPSLQLLGVVVKAEKYHCVRHKPLNVIMTAFTSDISIFFIVLFCFSTFLAP